MVSCYTKKRFYWFHFQVTVVIYLTIICVRPIWQDKIGVA